MCAYSLCKGLDMEKNHKNQRERKKYMKKNYEAEEMIERIFFSFLGKAKLKITKKKRKFVYMVNH